jgi:hypothetical protein
LRVSFSRGKLERTGAFGAPLQSKYALNDKKPSDSMPREEIPSDSTFGDRTRQGSTTASQD